MHPRVVGGGLDGLQGMLSPTTVGGVLKVRVGVTHFQSSAGADDGAARPVTDIDHGGYVMAVPAGQLDGLLQLPAVGYAAPGEGAGEHVVQAVKGEALVKPLPQVVQAV